MLCLQKYEVELKPNQEKIYQFFGNVIFYIGISTNFALRLLLQFYACKQYAQAEQ